MTTSRLNEEVAERSSSSCSNSNSRCPRDDSPERLVEATLIRDADEGSNSSSQQRNARSDPPIALPVIQPLEEPSAAFSIVVEASPFHEGEEGCEGLSGNDTDNNKANNRALKWNASRKAICAVMVILLAVIAALSIGFIVSGHQNDDNNTESAATANNQTQKLTPTAVPLSDTTFDSSWDDQKSTSPTVTPIPVLQRLADHSNNEKLRCGVLPGPGLFYYEGNDTTTPLGLDAALVGSWLILFSFFSSFFFSS